MDLHYGGFHKLCSATHINDILKKYHLNNNKNPLDSSIGWFPPGKSDIETLNGRSTAIQASSSLHSHHSNISKSLIRKNKFK